MKKYTLSKYVYILMTFFALLCYDTLSAQNIQYSVQRIPENWNAASAWHANAIAGPMVPFDLIDTSTWNTGTRRMQIKIEDGVDEVTVTLACHGCLHPLYCGGQAQLFEKGSPTPILHTEYYILPNCNIYLHSYTIPKANLHISGTKDYLINILPINDQCSPSAPGTCVGADGVNPTNPNASLLNQNGHLIGSFRITATPILAGDTPCDAIPLANTSGCTQSLRNNTGYTNSPVTAPLCAGYNGKDMWFETTVGSNGSLLIETFQAPASALINCGSETYSGTCGSPTQINCDDNGMPSSLMPRQELVNRTPGENILMRFWEYGGNATGDFYICATSLDIECTNPTASSVWDVGSTYSVNVTKNFRMRGFSAALYKGGLFITNIVIGQPSLNFYNWTIPSHPSIVTDNDYQIKVWHEDDPGVYDFSDNFTINDPSNCNVIDPHPISETDYHQAACALMGDGIIKTQVDVYPDQNLIHGDGGLIVYKSLYEGATSPARYFPSYAVDIDLTNEPRFKMLEELSYLRWNSNKTVVQQRFRLEPGAPLRIFHYLYMLLRANDVCTDDFSYPAATTFYTSGGTEIDASHELYGVIKVAYDNGLIDSRHTNQLDAFILRKDAFLVLHRLRQKQDNSTLNGCDGFAAPKPSAAMLQNLNNYKVPVGVDLYTMGFQPGIEQGVFKQHFIGRLGFLDRLNVDFQVYYNSQLKHVPDEITEPSPLGPDKSYTTSYHEYITVVSAMTKPALASDEIPGTVTENTYAIHMFPDGRGKSYDYNPTLGQLMAPRQFGDKDGVQAVFTGWIQVEDFVTGLRKFFKKEYTNRRGHDVYMLKYIYDRYNNRTTLIYEDGYTIQRENGTSGPSRRLKQITPASGGARSLNFEYFNDSESNRLLRVRDNSQSPERTIVFDYYADKKLRTFTDAETNTWTFSYHDGTTVPQAEGELETILHPEGNTTQIGYTTSHLATSITTPDNVTITSLPVYDYAADQITASVTVAVPGQAPSTTTSTIGFNEDYTSVNKNKTHSGTTSDGGPAQSYIVSFDPTFHWLPRDITNTTTGESSTTIYQNGLVKSYSVTAGGQTRTHEWFYDNNAWPYTVTRYKDPAGQIFQKDLNAQGGFLRALDADGNVMIEVARDGVGQISNVDRAGITNDVQLTNYVFGTATSVKFGDYETDVVVDNSGRITSVTFDGKQQGLTYDKNDFVVGETTPTRSLTHTINDNLEHESTQSGSGQTTMFTINPVTRLIDGYTINGMNVTFTRNATSNVIDAINWPGGTTQTITRNVKGEVTDDDYATYTRETDQTKPWYGAITNIGRKGTSLATDFTYNGFGEVTSTTHHYNDGHTATLGYNYNTRGLDSLITVGPGKQIRKTYDNSGRLIRVEALWLPAATRVIADYTYNTAGQITSTNLANGVTEESFRDDYGRVDSFVVKNGPVVLGAYKLQFGSNAKIKGWCYYAHYRNIGGYPDRNSITHNVNGLNNQLQSIIGTKDGLPVNRAVTHGPRGELKTMIDGAFSMTLDYDLDMNVTRFTVPSFICDLRYDGLGVMQDFVRNGIRTRYVNDVRGMSMPLVELDLSNNPKYYYIYGVGGVLVARINATSNDVECYHGNFRGDVKLMTNNSGNKMNKYSYNVNGECFYIDEPVGKENLFRFLGILGVIYIHDEFYYHRERFYNAFANQFYSMDEIWSINAYRYAAGDPVNMVDPSGLAPESIGIYSRRLGSREPSLTKNYILGQVMRPFNPYVRLAGLNLEGRHQVLVFGDGTFADYSNGVGIQTGAFNESRYDYTLEYTIPDEFEGAIRSRLQTAIDGTQYDGSNYKLFSNNCQDFVDDLVVPYEKAMRKKRYEERLEHERRPQQGSVLITDELYFEFGDINRFIIGN